MDAVQAYWDFVMFAAAVIGNAIVVAVVAYAFYEGMLKNLLQVRRRVRLIMAPQPHFPLPLLAVDEPLGLPEPDVVANEWEPPGEVNLSYDLTENR